jgi:hemolysin activation/secretion protein
MSKMYKTFWQVPVFKGVVNAGLVSVAMLWQACALAQPTVPEASGATTKFTISGFELTGDIPLSSEETTRVLAPFIGPDGTLLTLQKATAALEAELKAKGYSLHRVSLPPQEVGAKVTLNIVKFVIGKVTVTGLSRYSEANIRASVPELQEGEAPNFGKLAIQTAIANQNPGKQLQVSLGESVAADKIDAKLAVVEAKPWNFSVSLSNTGSDATGNDRLSLVGGHSNVFDRDHQFAGAYTTSLERANDVKQLGLNYRIPLYRQGGVIGLSYTKSDVVGSFGTFNSTGAGQTFGVNYSHYLVPVGGRRSFLSIGLEEKHFEAGKINGVPVFGQLDRGSRPLTVGYNARVESDAAVWGYNTELAVNLPGNAGNDLAAYRSEDARISNVNWRALRGSANYLSFLTSGWWWGVRGQFQYSPDALIAGEQFGLGGASSVRGTGERVISGDSGLLTSLEVTTPELQPGLRLLGFMDAGWLSNHNSVVNPNKPASDQLVSAGLGLRYTSGSYGFSAEWGRVLTGSVLPSSSGSDIPQSGDQKIHLNFTARF